METIPYERIKISNELGNSDRAWMEEKNTSLSFKTWVHRVIRMQRHLILQPNGKWLRQVFIHELTHVWQAFKGNKSVFTRLAAWLGEIEVHWV